MPDDFRMSLKKISRPLGPAILLYRVGYAFFSQKEQNVRYAMHTAMTITEPV